MAVGTLNTSLSRKPIHFYGLLLIITAFVLLYRLEWDHEPVLPGTSHHIHHHKHENKQHAPVQVLSDDYIYQSTWGASPIVVESHKLIFFWVTKAGCTTFKTLFRRMMGYKDWKTNLNVHYPKTNGLAYLNQYTLNEATAMMSSPDYTRAMIVRDPKERFLSAYLDKAVARNGSFVVLACCHKNKQCRSQIQTFQGFFDLTQNCHNPHWNPQGHRIGPKFVPTLDFVGRMGNITSDARALLEKIGAWEQYGKTGWGPHGNESIFASRNGLSASHRTSDSTFDSWTNLLPKYYREELEAAVEARFNIDYATPEFGLTRRKIVFS